MRLIDADALMETLGVKEHCEDCQYHHHDVYCNRSCDFVTACEAISDAPTIEPERKRGRLEYVDYGGFGNWHCTVCKRIIICNGDYDFCPYCGADLREGGK